MTNKNYAIPSLEVFDLAHLLHEEFEPLQWIIPDYLPEGLTLLVSRPKVGKSMTALALSLRVARNVSGGVDGHVLYLSLDDTNKRRMQSRTRSLLQGEMLEKDRIWGATRSQSLDDGLIGQLEEWMEFHPLTRLIVIDVYARVKPKLKDDDVYKSDYDALIKLQEFAVKHHIAIILVHHTRKAANTSGDWADDINGSTGLSGAADSLWKIERTPRSNDLTLRVKGRDVMTELEIHFSLDDLDAPWSLAEEDTPEEQQRVSEMERQILDLLSAASTTKNDPWKPKEIAERIDGKPKSVSRILCRMAAKNLLSRSAYGAYELFKVRQVRQENTYKNVAALAALASESVSWLPPLPSDPDPQEADHGPGTVAWVANMLATTEHQRYVSAKRIMTCVECQGIKFYAHPQLQGWAVCQYCFTHHAKMETASGRAAQEATAKEQETSNDLLPTT